MREEYDFSQAKKNPYAKQLKEPVTIDMDEDTVRYFKDMALTSGIPHQTLINLYLSDCAAHQRQLTITWG